MNSRRSSSDELEATALFADHDVEEPIELDIRHLLRAHRRRLSRLLERSKRVSSGEPPVAMISVEIQNFGTEGGIKAK
jgi:hypothetical protein